MTVTTDPQPVNMQRIKDYRVVISEEHVCVAALFPRLRDHHRREIRKITKARRSEHLQQNIVCRTLQGYGTRVLRAAVTAYIRPKQDKASWNSSMYGGEAHEILNLAIDGCWMRESMFSFRVRTLKGYSCSSRRSYYHIHTGSTKWTQWVFKKR